MKRTAPFALTAIITLGLAACTPPTPPTPPTPGVSSIVLSCTASSVKVGETTTCAASVVSAGVEAQSTPVAVAVTFASSAPDRASVSAAGVVTGVAEGATSITASALGVTSNAVAMTVTSATTAPNNPGGTIFIAKGSDTLYTLPAAAGRLRADGTVAYTVYEGGSTVFYVYENGRSEKIYTVPQQNPQKITFPGCVDRSGNVVMIGQEQLFYFDRGRSAATPIPFPLVDDEPVLDAVCSPDGRIVGSRTDFEYRQDVEYSFEWRPGDATARALPPVNSGCIGCSVKDATAAGDVLFYNAVIRAGQVTSFPQNFRAGGLSEDGTVWGTSTTSTTDPMYLASWVNGTVAKRLEFPAPDPAWRGTQWWVVEANDTGQVLLGRQYEHSGGDGLQRDYFVYRGGALVQVVPPAGYDSEPHVISIDDQGRVLALISKESDLFSSALVLITP